MSQPQPILTPKHNTDKRAFIGYTLGFIWSVILTLVAYLCVSHQIFQGWTLLYAISALALVQTAVQLFCFLHVTAGTKPRWRLISLLFMIVVVGIVVIGSLWIMRSLRYHMWSPAQITKYMNDQVGL